MNPTDADCSVTVRSVSESRGIVITGEHMSDDCLSRPVGSIRRGLMATGLVFSLLVATSACSDVAASEYSVDIGTGTVAAGSEITAILTPSSRNAFRESYLFERDDGEWHRRWVLYGSTIEHSTSTAPVDLRSEPEPPGMEVPFLAGNIPLVFQIPSEADADEYRFCRLVAPTGDGDGQSSDDQFDGLACADLVVK